jgi:hypothetical protein
MKKRGWTAEDDPLFHYRTLAYICARHMLAYHVKYLWMPLDYPRLHEESGFKSELEILEVYWIEGPGLACRYRVKGHVMIELAFLDDA